MRADPTNDHYRSKADETPLTLADTSGPIVGRDAERATREPIRLKLPKETRTRSKKQNSCLCPASQQRAQLHGSIFRKLL